MGSIDIQAFVETSFTASRALKLNEIVDDCGIAIMLGGKGAGKDRFLDWWWQVGASSKSIPDHLRVSLADTDRNPSTVPYTGHVEGFLLRAFQKYVPDAC